MNHYTRIVLASALALAVAGCATKGYVNDQVGMVDQKVLAGSRALTNMTLIWVSWIKRPGRRWTALRPPGSWRRASCSMPWCSRQFGEVSR